MIVKCARCGIPFESGTGRRLRKYCDVCVEPARREKQAAWEKLHRSRKKKVRISVDKSTNKTLTDINSAAKSCGMSYGQYVAIYGV